MVGPDRHRTVGRSLVHRGRDRYPGRFATTWRMNSLPALGPEGADAGRFTGEAIRSGALATARSVRFRARPEGARCPSSHRSADRRPLRSPGALSGSHGASDHRRAGADRRTRRHLVDPDPLRRLRGALRPWIEKPPRSLYAGAVEFFVPGPISLQHVRELIRLHTCGAAV